MNERLSQIETTYIGGLLNDPDEIPFAVEFLGSYDWADKGCKRAFEILRANSESNIATDAQIMLSQLDNDLTSAKVADLITNGPKSQNLAYYRDCLIKVQQTKKAANAADKLRSKAYAGTFDLDAEINEIIAATTPARKSLKKFDEVFDETLEEIERELTTPEGIGFKMGWNEFDRITSGLHPKDLVIVAARPSMGKTAFGLNLLNKAMQAGKRCLFFSLEMDNTKVMRRLISLNAKINGIKLITGSLNDDELDRLVALKQRGLPANYYMSDLMGTMTQIKAQTMQAKSHLGHIDFIMVDYLQLIRTNDRKLNREREIAKISGELKQIARENECTVIAISQLSRQVDSRNPPKPFMSDLRDSGSIEQDADQVMLLYREDYYNPNSNQPGVTEVNIAKNRNGSIGTAYLRFSPQFMEFMEE